MSWWHNLTGKKRSVFGSAAPQNQGGCDHGAISLRQGTAEYEWFVARGELEMRRDLKHGASHLANLLSYDPGQRDWIELLEGYLHAAEPNPEALIPRGDKLYFSTEAMRAYLWHKQGRLVEAVDLLAQVVQAKRDARYLEAWALAWLEPAGAVESLPHTTGMQLFSLLLGRFPEASRLPLPRLKEVGRWARLLDRFTRQHPADGMTTMLRAGLHRKAGNYDEALAIVRASLQRSPDWHTATALGLILRQQGNLVEAEKAFQMALRHDPDDISARLEAGDLFFERQEWRAALKWYENALGKEPAQPWARPSALYCRWQLTGDEKHIRDLVALARKDPDNHRAQHLWWLASGGGLPEPVDAAANLLRQFRDAIVEDPAKAPSGEAKMTLSCLEAPSNYLAIRLDMAALQHDLRVTVVSTHLPKPDPRQPMTQVKYLLWRYDDLTASPGLPPPGKDVAARIGDIAALPFDQQAYWAAASHAAADFGPGRVAEILAVMVHPPAVPTGSTALAWLPRVQFAAAAIAAQVDDGWEGSVRRDALYAVLHGPMDWTTEAAIRALTHLGCEQEPIAPDIHEAFQLLADHRPDIGHWSWVRTLFDCWQQLPHLYPQEREAMQQVLQEMNASDEEAGNAG
jgi:thioredoxin-like negative regulator of GroEL